MKQAAAATIEDPKNNVERERFGKLIGFDHTPDVKRAQSLSFLRVSAGTLLKIDVDSYRFSARVLASGVL